tara:strand:- start:113 stop:1237 length:1125 start_codon:yes stop_codon:yes gene_type:complete
MIDFWSYKKEYKRYKKSFHKIFADTLKNGQVFFGKNLKKFESNFTKKYKIKYGIAVGSGTDAILISLMALKLKKGDEVITASNTAIPTISAIVNSGATPRLVDINDDYLMNINDVKKSISKKTKVIIPVHLYGKPCDMNELLKISKKNNIHIIEDCAQAQGAKFNNKFVGTFGTFGCFSFYPTKILGAYGDGGFILTNKRKFYEEVKKIRFYGIDTVNKKNKFYNKYYSNINGVNSRLDEINSYLLDFKLKKVDSFIQKRRKLAKVYQKLLENTSLFLPQISKIHFEVFHLYTVYHPKRDFIIHELKKKGIQTRVIYPYPIHKMKAYKNYFIKKKFKKSEIKSKGIFSLPLYPELKEIEVKKICKILTKILNDV